METEKSLIEEGEEKNQFTIGDIVKDEIDVCALICGNNPKPPCYGEYPNCILRYRKID